VAASAQRRYIYARVGTPALKEILVTQSPSQDSSLRRLVRDRLGLQIGDEMAKYLAARSAQSPGPLTIIAQDARTGIPIRQTIDPNILALEPS